MILAFKIMIARLGYGRDAVTFSVISANFGMRMAPASKQSFFQSQFTLI